MTSMALNDAVKRIHACRDDVQALIVTGIVRTCKKGRSVEMGAVEVAFYSTIMGRKQRAAACQNRTPHRVYFANRGDSRAEILDDLRDLIQETIEKCAS